MSVNKATHFANINRTLNRIKWDDYYHNVMNQSSDSKMNADFSVVLKSLRDHGSFTFRWQNIWAEYKVPPTMKALLKLRLIYEEPTNSNSFMSNSGNIFDNIQHIINHIQNNFGIFIEGTTSNNTGSSNPFPNVTCKLTTFGKAYVHYAFSSDHNRQSPDVNNLVQERDQLKSQRQQKEQQKNQTKQQEQDIEQSDQPQPQFNDNLSYFKWIFIAEIFTELICFGLIFLVPILFMILQTLNAIVSGISIGVYLSKSGQSNDPSDSDGTTITDGANITPSTKEELLNKIIQYDKRLHHEIVTGEQLLTLKDFVTFIYYNHVSTLYPRNDYGYVTTTLDHEMFNNKKHITDHSIPMSIQWNFMDSDSDSDVFSDWDNDFFSDSDSDFFF